MTYIEVMYVGAMYLVIQTKLCLKKLQV